MLKHIALNIRRSRASSLVLCFIYMACIVVIVWTY